MSNDNPSPDMPAFALTGDTAAASAWTSDDTQAYLTAYPLPPDFRWAHRDYPGQLRPVHPTSSHLKGGYGKWLRETPYFPGLFELIHGLILEAGDQIPDPATLAAQLTRRRAGL